MMAISNVDADNAWYANTGATNHITFDVNNFSLCFEY